MDEEFDIRRESLKTDQDFESALLPVLFEDFAGQDKTTLSNIIPKRKTTNTINTRASAALVFL